MAHLWATINRMAAGLERQIQEQAAKINALELASQMAGVVKYPMSYAYSAADALTATLPTSNFDLDTPCFLFYQHEMRNIQNG